MIQSRKKWYHYLMITGAEQFLILGVCVIIIMGQIGTYQSLEDTVEVQSYTCQSNFDRDINKIVVQCDNGNSLTPSYELKEQLYTHYLAYDKFNTVRCTDYTTSLLKTQSTICEMEKSNES